MDKRRWLGGAAAGAIGALFACTQAPDFGASTDDHATVSESDAGAASSPCPAGTRPRGGGTAGAFASLATCCDGKGPAHCQPTDKIPASSRDSLTVCPAGGLCVPDAIARGETPKKCASIVGPGACVSLCVKKVADMAATLTKDVCGDDERCAPCALGGTPTGACEVATPAGRGSAGECEPIEGGAPSPPDGSSAPGAAPSCPYDGPALVDPTTFPACADGAHCVPTAAVAPDLASQLAPCPTGLCAPDSFIAYVAKKLPPTCSTTEGLEGRCLNKVLPAVAKEDAAGRVSKATCNNGYDRCVPCFDPLDGDATGACTIACDQPKQPKRVFASCCSGKGTCVPKTAIAASEQSSLGQDSCAAQTDLCVPKENLDPAFKPKACTGSSLFGGAYAGVCLSDCIALGFFQKLGTSQGTCDDAHRCIPCTDPLTGKATGAPGCAP